MLAYHRVEQKLLLHPHLRTLTHLKPAGCVVVVLLLLLVSLLLLSRLRDL